MSDCLLTLLKLTLRSRVRHCSWPVGVSNIVAGLIISWSGFPHPAWIAFSVSVTAFLGCIFIEELDQPRKPTLVDYVIKLHTVFSMLKENRRLLYTLLMYILALGVYNFIFVGSDRSSMLVFETIPLCMDMLWISWWMFTQGITMCIGLYFLPKYGAAYLNDAGMIYAGFLSSAAGSFCLIVASNYFTVFFGEFTLITLYISLKFYQFIMC